MRCGFEGKNSDGPGSCAIECKKDAAPLKGVVQTSIIIAPAYPKNTVIIGPDAMLIIKRLSQGRSETMDKDKTEKV
tara:strand:- start:949 stop:1176 length:228 start_codon:yes stop_codon:yes gene_type:complete